MRNNPGENIKIDWKINEIVKPGHVNALTKAIKYDYVVAAGKVVKKSSKDDEPDDLYELCGSPAKVNDDISILINATMGVTLRAVLDDESEYIAGPLFKIDPSDFVSSGKSVHIYALCNGPWGGFGIKVESYRSVFIHTSGKRNAAVFLPGSERRSGSSIYVGSAWDMDQIDNSASPGSIVYEQSCDGKLPQGDVTRDTWMSNSLAPGGSAGVVRRLSYPDKNGNILLFANNGIARLDDDAGLSAEKPLDLSNAVTVDWTTWTVRGRVLDGGVYRTINENRTLFLDTDSMIEGVVYEIDVSCYLDFNDTDAPLSDGVSIIQQPSIFTFEYTAPGGSMDTKDIVSPAPSALPIIADNSTCDITISQYSGTTYDFAFSAPINQTYRIEWLRPYEGSLGTRQGCSVHSTPGTLFIDLGVPPGSSGTGHEFIRLYSNIGLRDGQVIDVEYKQPAYSPLTIAPASGNLYTPSSENGFASISPTLYKVSEDVIPSAESNASIMPRFRGTVYLMKSNGKAYVLGY
jgi:hypothetical protein